MSNTFRKYYSIPLPADAEPVTIKGIPSARFKRNGKPTTAPLTADGKRAKIRSPYHYGWVNGKEVKLYTDAVASQQKLAELTRKAERNKTDLADPFDEHRLTPLVDHLGEWQASLERLAGEVYVQHSVNNVRRILETCGFKLMRDISSSRLEAFLVDMRRENAIAIDPAKETYTKKELAALIGINLGCLPPLIRRHRLTGIGNGKARRYPKATAAHLCELRRQGHSIKTSNLYLAAFKRFCGWMVLNKRMLKSPVEHLAGGNVQTDRRHDRRILDAGQLRNVIHAAGVSEVSFRGLSGRDREVLYTLACATGFRASELASLTPESFDLEGDVAKVTLSATNAKNKRTAEQPLSADAAATLRDYLEGRPANAIIWPGTWPNKAADMLRIDLETVGIPYVIQGTDGPLYADFHCLRHSFIAMLDKSGATLKEAMQLARHSDPKLTMAVYGRARLLDLAGAVDRMPSLSASEPVKASRTA